ncbi:TetR/AcrR family transcriptional regulator [Gordonia neofelifaecis]|uniref:TetR family transcriptional regulator n=1 Tax=Gordonia neofelifaecis NRRL B-59395 TaxID=644548 RepID=F1YIZ0_9ACTN|nr:TetR/AcrR family transcriptional regulator [Gordonia neofelifaecis]EGD55437.1 TetR family transcriptional regulator [Gordonia neofelifaecis NRRL B-59395]
MGRQPRYSTDELLDAALDIALAKGIGAVTMTAVATATGAPSGSMYHRFASRDELMARLWLRTIQSFQAGLLEALSLDGSDAVIDACLGHVFTWTDANPDLARLMLTYSENDIVGAWHDTLAVELRAANDRVRTALTEFTRRHFGDTHREHIDRTIYALVDLPYTAVRRHLPDGRPRPWLRTFTRDAARRVLTNP